ncbi:hypothetical protein Amir_4831 [Actinosynnema mirum DSM 43827]|uniref:Uncharacterized protein n=1 Tax=Actinosynnema mirum (strain ATCC 29888 / DSM 43827 / JCM 3225 / NBRC 14064 / NCIMB 13271 / NRRL B-12336 / IMRU 3971 / 101) TaxID=446462 RepID=C6WPF6_ACTMD|nr:hypothetical protein Amir_4831 [Actinosynnema mirum DSM 43827]
MLVLRSPALIPLYGEKAPLSCTGAGSTAPAPVRAPAYRTTPLSCVRNVLSRAIPRLPPTVRKSAPSGGGTCEPSPTTPTSYPSSPPVLSSVKSPPTTSRPSASAAYPVAVNDRPTKTLIASSRPANPEDCLGLTCGYGLGQAAPTHGPGPAVARPPPAAAAVVMTTVVAPTTTAAMPATADRRLKRMTPMVRHSPVRTSDW